MSPKEQQSRGLQGNWPAKTSTPRQPIPATALSRCPYLWGVSEEEPPEAAMLQLVRIPEFPAEHGAAVPRRHRV